MKIAVFSDIHDNEARLKEALTVIKKEGIKIGICCGDISRLETLEVAAKPFRTLYVALGNMDHHLSGQTGLYPENVEFSLDVLRVTIDKRKIAVVHHDSRAKQLAKQNEFDLIFYGHTHTPWEKKIGNTIMLNPGEVTGQFGPASFAIYDLTTMKATQKLIK